MVLRAWSLAWDDIDMCASQTEIAKNNQIIKKPVGLWKRLERGRRVVFIFRACSQNQGMILTIYIFSPAGVGNLCLSSACSLPCSNPKTKKSGQCSLFPFLSFLSFTFSVYLSVFDLCSRFLLVWIQYASRHMCSVSFRLSLFEYLLFESWPFCNLPKLLASKSK